MVPEGPEVIVVWADGQPEVPRAGVGRSDRELDPAPDLLPGSPTGSGLAVLVGAGVNSLGDHGAVSE